MATIDRSEDRPDARTREIHLSLDEILAWVDAGGGEHLSLLVHLDWTELRLTPAQRKANAEAIEDNEDPPYYDPQLVLIVVE